MYIYTYVYIYIHMYTYVYNIYTYICICEICQHRLMCHKLNASSKDHELNRSSRYHDISLTHTQTECKNLPSQWEGGVGVPV